MSKVRQVVDPNPQKEYLKSQKSIAPRQKYEQSAKGRAKRRWWACDKRHLDISNRREEFLTIYGLSSFWGESKEEQSKFFGILAEKGLNPNEIEVLMHYFGLDGREPLYPEEIAEVLASKINPSEVRLTPLKREAYARRWIMYFKKRGLQKLGF